MACGEFHTLVLTKSQDMYAWGRGFEGQLGVRHDVDTASVPMFVSFFYKNPATRIACGTFHSLAIDGNVKRYSNYNNIIKGRMYGWGEGRFG